MIIIVMLCSLILRGDFMQEEKKPKFHELPAEERERIIRESRREHERLLAERKEQLKDVEIFCEIETFETQPTSRLPEREVKSSDGVETVLAPVYDEPEFFHYSLVKISFINHSAASIDMGLFDPWEIVDLAVFDQTGKRLPDRPRPQRKVGGGYSHGIEPGGRLSTQLNPTACAEIKNPGVYRIEISTVGDVHSLMKITNRTLTYNLEERKKDKSEDK
jgi:hypothetical protein